MLHGFPHSLLLYLSLGTWFNIPKIKINVTWFLYLLVVLYWCKVNTLICKVCVWSRGEDRECVSSFFFNSLKYLGKGFCCSGIVSIRRTRWPLMQLEGCPRLANAARVTLYLSLFFPINLDLDTAASKP